MNIITSFYRKELPEEYVPKIITVLTEKGILWHEFIGALQPLLKSKGVIIYSDDGFKDKECETNEIKEVNFTDEPQKA